MKKSNAIYAITTAIVILLASLVGCDCVTATDWGFGPIAEEQVADWGFGPIQPEATEVESANILEMKTPAAQEIICDENGCRVINTVPMTTSEGSPVVTTRPMFYYTFSDDTCPCGCGMAGCNCGGGAMVASTEAVTTYTVTMMATPVTYQRQAVFMRGNGYGLFGLRTRPLGWRIRSLFCR